MEGWEYDPNHKMNKNKWDSLDDSKKTDSCQSYVAFVHTSVSCYDPSASSVFVIDLNIMHIMRYKGWHSHKPLKLMFQDGDTDYIIITVPKHTAGSPPYMVSPLNIYLLVMMIIEYR